MSHPLTNYTLTYTVSIPAHDEEEAEELVYDYLDLGMGPDFVDVDLEAPSLWCEECDEEEDEGE